jgi:hypothetical protein
MKESKIIEEFQAEARAEIARLFILDGLQFRFGEAAAAQCAPLLNAITDNKRLTELHRLALRCSRIKQFRDQLEEP